MVAYTCVAAVDDSSSYQHVVAAAAVAGKHDEVAASSPEVVGQMRSSASLAVEIVWPAVSVLLAIELPSVRPDRKTHRQTRRLHYRWRHRQTPRIPRTFRDGPYATAADVSVVVVDVSVVVVVDGVARGVAVAADVADADVAAAVPHCCFLKSSWHDRQPKL